MLNECWPTVDPPPTVRYYPFTGTAVPAVSPSLRPWIDVFALPEKFNLVVTEGDLDLKV